MGQYLGRGLGGTHSEERARHFLTKPLDYPGLPSAASLGKSSASGAHQALIPRVRGPYFVTITNGSYVGSFARA
jgi:hypothetical protein